MYRLMGITKGLTEYIIIGIPAKGSLKNQNPESAKSIRGYHLIAFR